MAQSAEQKRTNRRCREGDHAACPPTRCVTVALESGTEDDLRAARQIQAGLRGFHRMSQREQAVARAEQTRQTKARQRAEAKARKGSRLEIMDPELVERQYQRVRDTLAGHGRERRRRVGDNPANRSWSLATADRRITITALFSHQAGYSRAGFNVSAYVVSAGVLTAYPAKRRVPPDRLAEAILAQLALALEAPPVEPFSPSWSHVWVAR